VRFQGKHWSITEPEAQFLEVAARPLAQPDFGTPSKLVHAREYRAILSESDPEFGEAAGFREAERCRDRDLVDTPKGGVAEAIQKTTVRRDGHHNRQESVLVRAEG
jgi:hypothetical protein